MSLKRFDAEVKARLTPMLREQGFKVDKRAYRRITDGVVFQIFHIWLNKYGGGAYVDLNSHLTFLPTSVGPVPDPMKLRAPSCEMRSRLAPAGVEDREYLYGESDAQAVTAVDQIIADWQAVGFPHFERHRSFPGLYAQITPAMIRAGDLSLLPGWITEARAAYWMARVSVHRGLRELANEFIDVALADIEDRSAPILFRDLVKLRASLGANPS